MIDSTTPRAWMTRTGAPTLWSDRVAGMETERLKSIKLFESGSQSELSLRQHFTYEFGQFSYLAGAVQELR